VLGERRPTDAEFVGDVAGVGPLWVVKVAHPVGGLEHLPLAVGRLPAVDERQFVVGSVPPADFEAE